MLSFPHHLKTGIKNTKSITIKKAGLPFQRPTHLPQEVYIMEPKMFCYQCQETAGCSGCTISGVCGKKPDVAAMQDLLVYVTKGLSAITTALRSEGREIPSDINHMVIQNLFTTITNANFDKDSIVAKISETLSAKEQLLTQLSDRKGLPAAALWHPESPAEYESMSYVTSILATKNEDIRSLRELITYGLKGLCAYTSHANALLREDPELDAFIQSTLAKTLDDSLTAEELTALTLETGKFGVRGMALLDQANTETFGNPEITKVNIGTGKNPGILVSTTIFTIWKCFLSRQKEPALTFTLTPRCFRPLLSGVQKISELCRQLRKRLVETERRI